MTVLMAIGNKGISQMLSAPLKKVDMHVLQDEVIHRNYLNEMIEQNSPSMILIHDDFLQSDFDGDPQKRDKEMLELIEYWRIQYNDTLRVVYFTIRERTDPFIADLVARNVMDIFHEEKIVTVDMVQQLLEPKKYQNVMHFGVGKFELKELEQTEELVEPLEETTAPDIEEDVKDKKVNSFNKHLQGIKGNFKNIVSSASNSLETFDKEKIQNILNKNSDIETVINMMPEEFQKKLTRSTVIGTVLIGVAGVSENAGCTNTAISIAKVLSDKGHSVALVESNTTSDFDRIHSLYEGMKTQLADENFEIYGVQHYKNRSSLDLDEIFSTFEYVVMDYGHIESALNVEQFKRSHLKMILCSADEWKFYQLKEFEQRYVIDDSYCFIVPNANRSKEDLLTEQLKLKQVYAYPQMDNPYEPPKELIHMMPYLLGEFLKEPIKSNKANIFITGFVSVVVTLLVVLLFKIFS